MPFELNDLVTFLATGKRAGTSTPKQTATGGIQTQNIDQRQNQDYLTQGPDQVPRVSAESVPLNPERLRETLLEWKAPVRPILPVFNPKIIRSLTIIGVVIALLLLAVQQFVLILTMVSLSFVAYLLMQSPVDYITHKVTNQGIYYGDKFYFWHELRHFFFSITNNEAILVVDFVKDFPTRLFFVLENKAAVSKVKELLEPYVLYLPEVPQTSIEKLYCYIADKIMFTEKN